MTATSRCGVDDHCCWFKGQQCTFLIASDAPERNFACTLRAELGDWAPT